MENTSNTPQVRSAVGVKAMAWSLNPALIINPAATPTELFSWAVEELASLNNWLDIGASSACGFSLEAAGLAVLVTERLAPVMMAMHAALNVGGSEA